MTSKQLLYTFIDNLSKCQTNQRIAVAQNSIVNFIHSSQSSTLTQSLNMVISKTNDFNFVHILRNLFSDLQFIQKHQTQLVDFLVNKLTQSRENYQHQLQQDKLSRNKELLLIEFLFNCKILQQSNKTFLTVLMETKCREDLIFCYKFLSSVNQLLSETINQEREQLNMNEISMLAIRVIKNWNKLPDYLVDQALKFVNVLLIPKLISSQQSINEAKQIMTLLLNYVTGIISSQTHMIGNAYKFLGMYLSSYQKLGFVLGKQVYINIVEFCRKQVQRMFPNLQQLHDNCLQTQIQKTTQCYYDTETNNNDKEKTINNIIRANLVIQLLKGISSFISELFTDLVSEYSRGVYFEVLKEMKQNKTLKIFKKVFQMLSFCNDKQIFFNFIQVCSKKEQINQELQICFNFNQEHLMKQIIRNCPTPITDLQSIELDSPFCGVQLRKVSLNLKIFIQQWIKQGKSNQMLDLIKEKIQKQYDQAFNSRQFQSAINTLTLIFKSTQQIVNHLSTQKQTLNAANSTSLSKDEVIEWIKALLNLNESCLPVHRKIVIAKTYQVLCEVYNIILPGNQHLQEVIENELIAKSYPLKKQCLQKLIMFYEKYGNTIFQEGYKNKIEVRRFCEKFHSILSQSYQRIQIEDEQNTNQPSSKEKILSTEFTHSTFRKYKILQKMYNKIQQKQLSLKERIYLWTLIVRIHKMQPSINKLFSIEDVKKLFYQRQDILYARHLASEMVSDEDTRQLLKLQNVRLEKVINHFKEYPFFYRDELRSLVK